MRVVAELPVVALSSAAPTLAPSTAPTGDSVVLSVAVENPSVEISDSFAKLLVTQSDSQTLAPTRAPTQPATQPLAKPKGLAASAKSAAEEVHQSNGAEPTNAARDAKAQVRSGASTLSAILVDATDGESGTDQADPSAGGGGEGKKIVIAVLASVVVVVLAVAAFVVKHMRARKSKNAENAAVARAVSFQNPSYTVKHAAVATPVPNETAGHVRVPVQNLTYNVVDPKAQLRSEYDIVEAECGQSHRLVMKLEIESPTYEVFDVKPHQDPTYDNAGDSSTV